MEAVVIARDEEAAWGSCDLAIAFRMTRGYHNRGER